MASLAKLSFALCMFALAFIAHGARLGATVNKVNHLHQLAADQSFADDIYSGYLSIDPSGAGSMENGIFYYFAESRGNPTTDPVLVWMNGGPGASSMFGAFLENGPYFIFDNGTITRNEHSWNQHANVLYFDQPIGVGYSYGPRQVSTSEQAASDLYFAIQYFFRAFPQYLPNPFFISGESYAGKYVPLTSYEVLKGNAAIRAPWKKINLQGCAIGNGWVHPITQNQAYVDYPYNLGLIGEKQHDEAQKIMNELRISILSEDWLKAQDLSNDLENVVVSNAGVDEDNILYPVDPMGAGIDALTTYLNTPTVRRQMGALSNVTWSITSDQVYNNFNADEQKSVRYVIPLLVRQIRVMIYTGNMDLNCNVAGVDAYIREMQWPDWGKYYDAPRTQWNAGGTLVGYAKRYESFMTVVVRNAGHEVPFFQPVAALDMINRFLKNLPFD